MLYINGEGGIFDFQILVAEDFQAGILK